MDYYWNFLKGGGIRGSPNGLSRSEAIYDDDKIRLTVGRIIEVGCLDGFYMGKYKAQH